MTLREHVRPKEEWIARVRDLLAEAKQNFDKPAVQKASKGDPLTAVEEREYRYYMYWGTRRMHEAIGTNLALIDEYLMYTDEEIFFKWLAAVNEEEESPY